MEFYDRKKELSYFRGLAQSKQLIVMYGRRRVGKTAIVKELLKTKKGIYFFVETQDKDSLLTFFSNTIAEQKGYNIKFSDWDSFFKYLLENFSLIVFDEFQNFERVDKSLFSKLQNIWDDSKTETTLILIGSYTGMMKKIFEDAKEPLFGRADNIINLRPFTFQDTYDMLKDFGYNIEQSVELYSVFDGIPKYLLYCRKKKDIYELINSLFLDDFAPLKEEGKNLLVGEFGSEHRGYFSVLAAIGTHAKTQGEIVDKSGLDKDKVGKYLFDLRKVYDICEKQQMVAGEKKKNNKYYIKDNFYKFWFGYIYSNYSLLQINPEKVFTIIKKTFKGYTGHIFERVCMEFLISRQMFKFTKIGRQWGRILTAPKGENTYEIDIVALDEDSGSIGFFECKWMDLGKGECLKILEELKEKSKHVDWRNGSRIEKFGLIGKKIKGKKELRAQGYLVWDLDDF